MVPDRKPTRADPLEDIAQRLRDKGRSVEPSDFELWLVDGAEVTAAQMAYIESNER